MHAAVNVQHHPGCGPGQRAGQVGDGGGHLIGSDEASGRLTGFESGEFAGGVVGCGE
jgi:hypothetical protein